MNQSNSTLSQEQLTESGELFASAANLAEKGLQQYFTPPALAELLARVMLNDSRLGHISVLDPTAGSGNLLRPFRSDVRADTFGIDIDKRHSDKQLGLEYADLLKCYKYLSELDVRFDKIVLNPPFGLEWEWEDKTRHSAELTLELADSLLTRAGEGYMIMHAGNWPAVERLVREDLDLYVYAVCHIENLFAPASSCESVLILFSRSSYAEPVELREERFDFGNFENIAPDLEARLIELRSGWWRSSDTMTPEIRNRMFAASCKAARDEAAAEGQTYTLELHGKQLRARLSDFQALKICKQVGESWLTRIRSWSGLTLKYFALNSLEADKIREAVAKNYITVEPGLLDKLAEAVNNSARYTAPFYPLKPTQSLGFLDKLDRIKCTCPDEENGFKLGEEYEIQCRAQKWEGTDYKTVRRVNEQGDLTESVRELGISGKYLQIQIGGRRFDEKPESIQYITSHFEVPDPGDITTHLPAVYNKHLKELKRLESHKFNFRDFQLKDLARLLCRDGGVLAWEQGLGKMIGGLGWALVKKYKRVLIVCPQDLIPQWTNEARDKFGIELIRLRTAEECRRLSKRPKTSPPFTGGQGGVEFFIIHYEALSRNGRMEETAPEVRWPTGSESVGWGEEKHRIIRYASSKGRCPHCRHKFAWNGLYCNPRITDRDREGREICGCGYVHYSRRKYSAAHYLKNTFSGVIVDEGTKIKGDTSLMGLAVRSLRPKGRLILTGTPIKNFLHDSFWLLWWATGATVTESFPYGHNDRQKFLSDFCVLEWEKACRANKHQKGAVKARPEICNLSLLWKTLAPNILRRRKSETGENLVSKRLVPLRSPFGEEQQKTYAWWVHNFGSWYANRSDTSIDKSSTATALAGVLGQLWKLRFAASTPASDHLTPYEGRASESNYTPKLLTCLQLIREGLEAREPVVVFNTMKDSSQLLREELTRVGVQCRVVDGDTKPADRAQAMLDFKAGKFMVLLAGLEAVNLGHNLENCRRAIVYSLPFDLAGFDQAINRIHRLTSLKDVCIHVLLTSGSIDEKMWGLIERKGGSAGLALDGKLGFDDVEEINWNEFAKELREEFEERETIPEAACEARVALLWNGLNLITRSDGSQLGAAAGLLDTVSLDNLQI